MDRTTLLALILIIGIPTVFYDIRSRRIPNWITIPACFTGLALAGILAGSEGLASSVRGLFVGGGTFFMLFLMGWMGAGDVKLLGAVGAIFGYPDIVNAVLLTVLTGGVLAVAQMTLYHTWNKCFSRFRLIRRKETEPENQSFAVTVPYGLAIVAGSLMAAFMH
jgi:prepilin peptidase CpaA